jgi:large repetitive protein
MNKSIFYAGVLTFSISFGTQAQFPGCPSVNAGSDQNLSCDEPCAELTADPFPSGATTSYTVNSIPHTPPINYNAAGGTAVSVGQDDVWSPIITLPFTFCYYGQSYTTCKVGSNGAIQLGPASGGGGHPWSFADNCPSTNLVNAGHIFGVYHDVDPTKGSPTGTVRYHILGEAPCRIFAVSFDNLAHFGSSCSANTFRSTFMMVLYETTNVIDVYVQRKDLCTAWNSGRAIVGIQNQNGTQGIAAPGRNTTPTWSVLSSVPEGWRFTPDGAPIYSVEWLENGTVISNDLTINVCPSTLTTYTARATYQACDGATVVVEDEVTVNPPADAPVLELETMTPATCGNSNGSIGVTASGGDPGYEFSIDGGNTFQTSGTFSGLAQGSYVITVVDASGCLSQQTFEVDEDSDLAYTISSTDVSCFGETDGEIIVQGVDGSGTYSYSLNGGTAQSSGTFSGLTEGTYTIDVVDSDGCEVSVTIEIIEPNEINLDLINQINISCFGANDGEIIVIADGGTEPFSYSLNGGPGQTSGDFTNLAAGSYEVNVEDQSGCSSSITVSLTEPTPVPTTIEYTQETYCAIGNANVNQTGVTGGTYSGSPAGIVINANNGTINLEASEPGVYTITYAYDDSGCSYSVETEIEILPLPTIFAGDDMTICEGESITLAAQGGVSYDWSGGVIDGESFVPGAGTVTYTVLGTDANGCQNTSSVTITVNPTPTVTFTANPTSGMAPLAVEFTNNSSGSSSFVWDFGNGSSTSENNVINHLYPDGGVYTVILIGEENGCTDTHTITIIVEFDPPIFDIPNIFTPNNDGTNDFFFLINASGLDNLSEFNMVILNRWGNVIRTFDNPYFQWDGRDENGNDVSPGTYFYKLTAKDHLNEDVEKHGFVQVSR